jgi:hypothetical protein
VSKPFSTVHIEEPHDLLLLRQRSVGSYDGIRIWLVEEIYTLFDEEAFTLNSTCKTIMHMRG